LKLRITERKAQGETPITPPIQLRLFQRFHTAYDIAIRHGLSDWEADSLAQDITFSPEVYGTALLQGASDAIALGLTAAPKKIAKRVFSEKMQAAIKAKILNRVGKSAVSRTAVIAIGAEGWISENGVF
jgi:hypothetical protein